MAQYYLFEEGIVLGLQSEKNDVKDHSYHMILDLMNRDLTNW